MLTFLRHRFSGLTESIIRYPLTVAFLIATAILTAINIADGNNLIKFIVTCAVGAVSSAAAQSAWERFFSGAKYRVLLYIAAFLLTVLFYVSIMQLSENGMEMITRTAVTMFALFIAYIWIAVVRGRYSFNESFMAAFKAFFQSAFFSGIIFLGCAAIIAAIDWLITPVDSDAYSHTANIVFIIVAPLFFLSLIPVYPGRDHANLSIGEESQEIIKRRTGCPKFLEVLLSYIIIPLASIFTLILLIYIFLNIGGKFWTNNLLEPLLISYSITIIVVTLLVSQLENRFAVLFRMIFPKILIPIALFQIIASILLLADTGVTYSRYYVILFGLFAVLSGVALSMMPMRKSGVIAVLLIVLSAISLIPPVDAFTVSRNSQIGTLENVLTKDGMLTDNKVIPNDKISDDDKSKIIASIQYLTSMDELGRVKWLPAGFKGYDDNEFYKTFGFHQYVPSNPDYRYINVYFNIAGLIPISGYDMYTQINVPNPVNLGPNTVEVNGRNYSLSTVSASGAYYIVIKDAAGLELSRFDTGEIFKRYASYPVDKSILTLDEATFTAENEKLALKIIILNAGFSTAPDKTDQNAQMLVFVKIK